MRFTEFISEAGSPKQQAAIAIAMKKAGKKPKDVTEAGITGSSRSAEAIAKQKEWNSSSASDSKQDTKTFSYQGYTINFTPDKLNIYLGGDLVFSRKGNFADPTKKQLVAARLSIGKIIDDKRREALIHSVIQKNKGMQGVAEDRENFNGINLLLQKDDEEVFVKASAGSRELGHVLFVMDGDYLMPQDLEVEERYRGQGIAQTMYDFVKSKGYKIRRSGQQTDAGAGFWAKHRPEQNVWEEGVAEGSLNEFAQGDFNGSDDSNDLQLYLNVAKKLNMKKYKPSTAHDLIAKKMAELVDAVDDEKVDWARHMARKAQGLPSMLDQQGVAEEKQRLDAKCWDGYKKQGTKMKGDTRVNNCVKEEELEEHIVKVKGGYELKSKHGDKNLGKYPTKAGAEKREKQVNYFKYLGDKK